ncbi:MAG: hypothetical protein IT584_03430 [Chlamydiae bacterium]|nr:hypothetical protein [Chlamydiota bacterium]
MQFLIKGWLKAASWLGKAHEQINLPEGEPASLLKIWFLSPLIGPLAPEEGILDRLSFYANILANASPVDEGGNLLRHLESMKHDAGELRIDLLFSKRSHNRDAKDLWQKWIEVSKEKLRELFDLFFVFFQEFRQDENLLFLLIEQKEPLNQYLGQRAVESILSRLFPQGVCTLREAIYNGYARRGFLDFYARNEELIESVDWKDPCVASTPKLES